MGVRDYLEEKKQERITDEKILNVIRDSEAGFVGTTEVSESEPVDLKEDAVRNRLENLEDDGRVHKKRVGHPERGNLAWYLAEEERERPVSPNNYWLARACQEGQHISSNVFRIGAVIALAGIVSVMLAITTNLFAIGSGIVRSEILLTFGYALVGGGFANIALGGLSKFALLTTEKRIINKGSPAS
jgi:hypothetical protein